MPRLVHLVRASRARAIERAGIRGGAAQVLVSGGQASRVERAVFAMPLLPDFTVTYQWVRELRRWHGEKMMAVHFVLPSDEEVLVGRYNVAHERKPLRDAVREVLKAPAGNEIVVTRSVRRSEVVGIRDVTQRVGWTAVPEAGAKFDCICPVCVPAGTPDLMRRVRGEFERHWMAVRKAKSPDELVAALGRLDMPFERARGKLSPDKLLRFTRAESARVRKAAGWLLGDCRWADVEAPLVRLLSDADVDVRTCAIESLVRAGGLRRTYDHVRESEESLLEFVDHVQYGSDVALSAKLLSRLALDERSRVRARAAKAAESLLRDDGLDEKTKAQLERARSA